MPRYALRWGRPTGRSEKNGQTPKEPTRSHQKGTTALIAHKPAHVMATEPPGETLPFAAAITVWLTSMADLSPRTLALYRESVDHFASWCTGKYRMNNV